MRRLCCLVVVAMLASVSMAQTPTCPRCACHDGPKQVCRTVPDVQRRTTTEYYSRIEELVMPGPSRQVRQSCTAQCTQPCKVHGKKLWMPDCGDVLRRAKLYKRPVTVETPSARLIVEHVCPRCGYAQLDEKATATVAYTRELPWGTWAPIQPAATAPAAKEGAKDATMTAGRSIWLK